MTPATSLVNGEANFEWRPAEKATTQLITHVTSETAKKYIYRQTPANSVIAEHHLTWTHHLATKREKKSRSSPEILIHSNSALPAEILKTSYIGGKFL